MSHLPGPGNLEGEKADMDQGEFLDQIHTSSFLEYFSTLLPPSLTVCKRTRVSLVQCKQAAFKYASP